jgi:hypothetical protein
MEAFQSACLLNSSTKEELQAITAQCNEIWGGIHPKSPESSMKILTEVTSTISY